LAGRPTSIRAGRLATKLGMDMGGGRKGLRPEWIRQAVRDSLRRLQTDPVDRAAYEADLQALCGAKAWA
jgi:hypothetical protein